MLKKIEEGKVRLVLSSKVFFNPEMEFCRDISTIAVQAYANDSKKRISIVDGLCASGVRGIRYRKENSNIGKVVFVDVSSDACKLARRNAELNKLRNFEVHKCDVNDFLYHNRGYNVVEIDPFGTPLPYLYDSINSFKKEGLLSVTATDTAVLCGAHSNACIKNYGAFPLDNEYCHETGIRILIGAIARIAASLNFGIEAYFSLSRQHFLKVFIKLKSGADVALLNVKRCGFISHCSNCLNREVHFGINATLNEKCSCGARFKHAGPLFLGELWNEEFVKGMLKINESRNYRNKWRIANLLLTIGREAKLPATYYDLHKISEKTKKTPKRLEFVIQKLREAGFKAERTHFKENSIRTNANVEVIKGIY
jgi:tRNA (guanine26-N2/guanine27-N2)-dimethyltransferase